jgi:four helix bundle protein
LNRCAVSVPSNIAEGAGRNTSKDFERFLSIALGSAFELETQLYLSKELFGLEIDEIELKIDEVQKMIVGFKNSIENRV